MKYLKYLQYPLLASLMLCSCDDSSDPSVITRNDLKAPSALQLIDNGNGQITLRWQTANYEDDFEGYNVYGAKVDTTTLTETWGLTIGEPIQLLDNAGNAIAAARTQLSYFTYEADNEYALPGIADNTGATYTAEKEEGKFSALPYHKIRVANSEANLPTCKPLTAGSCTGLGSSLESTEASNITSIGTVDFVLGAPDDVEYLEVGSQYCFFVFAVQDGGAEISQSSTNVECITPKFTEASITTTIGTGAQYYLPNDIRDFRASCTQDESTMVVSCTESMAGASSGTPFSSTSTTGAFQFERYAGSQTKLSIVAGKNAAIRSLGFFENGFEDEEFLSSISSINSIGEFTNDSVKLDGGFSNPGQSVLLGTKQIFVVANAPTDITATAADFYYDWIYIDSLSCPASADCSLTYTVLASKIANVLSR